MSAVTINVSVELGKACMSDWSPECLLIGQLPWYTTVTVDTSNTDIQYIKLCVYDLFEFGYWIVQWFSTVSPVSHVCVHTDSHFTDKGGTIIY